MPSLFSAVLAVAGYNVAIVFGDVYFDLATQARSGFIARCCIVGHGVSSSSSPCVKTLNPLKQGVGLMRAFPFAGDVLVRLGQSWINMYRAKYLV